MIYKITHLPAGGHIPRLCPVVIGEDGQVRVGNYDDPNFVGVSSDYDTFWGEMCPVVTSGYLEYLAEHDIHVEAPPTQAQVSDEEDLLLTEEEILYMRDMLQEVERSCRRPDGSSDLDPGELEMVHGLIRKLDA